MNIEEAVARLHALDEWVCRYPRSNTFAQFRSDYAGQDPELETFLATSDRASWNQDLQDAINSVGESLDIGGVLQSYDRPWRRISEGASYGDYRDDTLEDLYKKVGQDPDYIMSDAIRSVFDPIKQKLHSSDWVGRPRREQLDWLHTELQDLISRIQTRESAAVVHAYLYDFLDRYDVEGRDLDAPISRESLTS